MNSGRGAVIYIIIFAFGLTLELAAAELVARANAGVSPGMGVQWAIQHTCHL